MKRQTASDFCVSYRSLDREQVHEGTQATCVVGQTCEITFEHRGRGRRGDGEQGYGQHDGDRLLVADTCGTRDREAILGSAEPGNLSLLQRSAFCRVRRYLPV